MKKTLPLVIALSAALLGGCATEYQSSGLSGGYTEKNIEGDIYRVVFGGNGYATRETVQTYWLYRCASLAQEKGFDGFEILSNINLTLQITPERFMESESPFKKAQMVFIPMDTGPKPAIEADIRLLKGPITESHPRIYDAGKLKEQLEPYVHGKKCSGGNVCEHAHKYVYPEGRI